MYSRTCLENPRCLDGLIYLNQGPERYISMGKLVTSQNINETNQDGDGIPELQPLSVHDST